MPHAPTFCFKVFGVFSARRNFVRNYLMYFKPQLGQRVNLCWIICDKSQFMNPEFLQNKCRLCVITHIFV